MSETILTSISNKNDYLSVAAAVTGAALVTEADAEQLMAVYEDRLGVTHRLSDKALIKLFMVLDTVDRGAKEPVKTAPLLGLLDEADQEGLAILAELCQDRNATPELAVKAKDAAMTSGMDEGLRLALARAALDALAGRRDIREYREDINALLGLLGEADEDKFHEASMFLWGVRAKWMN